MKYPVQVTEKPLRHLVMHSSDPNDLAKTNHLFKEGLALANQLDSVDDSDAAPINDQPLLDLTSAQQPFSEDSEKCLEDFTSVQSTPRIHTPHFRGLIKLNQGDLKGALDNFKRVLQKDVASVEALNALAVAQYRLNHFQDAVASLHAAIVLRPTQSTLYGNLGAVLYGSRDFLGAVASFQKAARLDPKDEFAYYGMGLSLIQQRNYHKAIAAFQRAVIINDQDAHSYYGLGYVHLQLGDLPAAIAAIGKAKQRNPQYAKRYEAFLKHCLAQDNNPQKT
jgi:tetratricopeptide (TPR) repeat protein